MRSIGFDKYFRTLACLRVFAHRQAGYIRKYVHVPVKCGVAVLIMVLTVCLGIAHADTYWAYRGKINYSFPTPYKIAIDQNSNVYILDDYGYKVTKFTSAGNLVCSVGSQGTGNAQFAKPPQAIAVDSTGQYFYVLEGDTLHRVQKFDASNCAYSIQWGTWDNTPTDGNFSAPRAIAVDSTGNIYVADTPFVPASNRVQKFSSAGTFLSKWTPTAGIRSLTYAGGNLYATQIGGSYPVVKYNLSGVVQSQFGTSGVGDGQMYDGGRQLAINAFNIFEADGYGGRAQVFDLSGGFITGIGNINGPYTGDGKFTNATGIGINGNNTLYVADHEGPVVQTFSTTSWNAGVLIDGLGQGLGTIMSPSLAIDNIGNKHIAYFAASSNLRYAKWNGISWTASTIATNAYGVGTDNNSVSMALDAFGNPHIAYMAATNTQVWYSSWTGTGWWSSKIDDGTDFVTMAISPAGIPHIVYGYNMKHAFWNGVGWSTSAVDGASLNPELAIDDSGILHLVYKHYDGGTDYSVKYARKTSSGWGVPETVVATKAYHPKIALDGLNRPHIAYLDGNTNPKRVKYTKWDGTTWVASESAATGVVTGGSLRTGSLVLDGTGRPHIIYYDQKPDLYTSYTYGIYHTYKNGAWTANPEIVDLANQPGIQNSLAIDSSGKLQIAYIGYDVASKLLVGSWTGSGYGVPMGGSVGGKVQMPTNLSGTRSGTNINWTWGDNSSNETGFRLYGSTNPSGPFSLIADTNVLTPGSISYGETALPQGTTYYRYVSAVNQGGSVTSNLSSVYVPAFKTPLNPLFTVRTSTSLAASWTSVSGANYVVVLSSNSSYSPVNSSTTISVNTKFFSGLDSATTYYFEVKLSTETDIAFSLNRISTATLLMPPAVSAITPSSGTNAGSVNVTNLAGADFLNGVTVKLTRTGQSDINAVSVVWVNSSKITCSLPLTGAATGTWNIVVTNPDAQLGQLLNGFTIKAVPPAPAAVMPNTGANNGTVAVTNLSGTGFQTGAAVKLTRAGEFDISVATVNVTSAIKITCVLPLTGATTGAWDIVVTNPDGQSGTLSNGFTIIYPAPVISAITPGSALNNASVDITNLAGTWFQAGAAVKLTRSGKPDVNAATVSVVSASRITCTLPLTGAATGAWNVVVTNPDTQTGTLPNGFNVLADTSGPVGVPSTPSAGILYSTSGAITFTWSQGGASDPESGISGYDLQVGIGAAADAGIFNGYEGNVFSKTFAGLAEAVYYARVRAKNGYDLPGNWSADSYGVAVDTTPPSPNPPAAGSHQVYISSITWAAAVPGDATSGLHSQPYSFNNGAAWQAGASSTTAGLQPNSFYDEVIKYRDAAGNITAGLAVSTYTLAVVPSAAALSNLSPSGFTLSWGQNGNPDGTTYVAEISKDGGFQTVSGSSSTLSQQADFTGLDISTRYYARVKAVNHNNVSANYSAQVPRYTLANPPGGAQVSGISSGAVGLTWSANGNSGSTVYRIARSLNNVDFDAVTTTYSTFAVVSALGVEAVNYFKVRAENGDGAATAFDVTVSTFVPDYTPPSGSPSTPADEGVFLSGTAATFSWTQGSASDSESGIAGYYLQVGTNSSSVVAGVFSGDVGSVLSQEITGLSDGKTYYARIRAKNGRGLYGGSYSNWSDGITIDTTPPQQPSVVSPTHPDPLITYFSGVAQFSLSAQDFSGIAGYYYKIDHSSATIPSAGSGAWLAVSSTQIALADGAWYAHFVSVDGAGNTGSSAGHYRFNVGNTINPSTDTVFQSEDGTKITIDSGTLSVSADILISVPSAVPPEARDSTLKDTGVYREISLSNPALTLQKSVRVSIPYTQPPISPADEDSLKLSHYNEILARWEVLYNSVVDKINNTVTAVVTHFSPFKIIAYSPQSAELANAGNYPNPFTAGQGGTTKIHYSLKGNRGVEIYIYDLLGRLVWHKSLPSGAVGGSIGVNDVAWDGKNDAGAYVGAGAYICVIKAGPEKKKIKIAVK